jgi:hypothetical protein
MEVMGMDILNIKMQENDADAETIGQYLKALLAKVWDEGEGFSGKRSFGNSGWEFEIYYPLVREGLVTGMINEDGELESLVSGEADKIISQAIKGLF